MEWISVKDRIPKNNNQVLIVENGRIVIGYYDDFYPVFRNHERPIEATHWMPLPNPPKDTQERLAEASNTKYIPLKG